MTFPEAQLSAFKQQKEQLLAKKASMRFSADIQLTSDEKKVDTLLKVLGNQIKSETYNPVNDEFFKVVHDLKKSKLYSCLDKMPKGGLHHLHTGSTPSAEFYVSLTYDQNCYYDLEKKIFKVSAQEVTEPQFTRCSELRAGWSSPEEFDAMLLKDINMSKEECEGSEREIWAKFEHKFQMMSDINRYHEYFRRTIYEILFKCAKQNLFVVELRHTPGSLFDDEGKPVSLHQEMTIMKEELERVRIDFPHTELRLIFIGLKIVGEKHIRKMIQYYSECQEFSEMVAGFDMANEEDCSPPISDFLEDIFKGKQSDAQHQMPCFLHCGESHKKTNYNVIDAVLLKSKRIGHGV
jgi:adenosine deaminase CECR1